MDFILQQSELADLAEKVEAGTRLEIEDALRLYRTPNLNALGPVSYTHLTLPTKRIV